MANQVHVQNLRGNTAKNNNYLGVDGEIVINSESHSLRIHDGVKQGGYGTVYAASSETAAYAAMHDLAEGALVIVGTSKPYKLYQKIGDNLVMKDLEAEIDIHNGTITTSGNTGDLGIRKIGDDYYIDATFPEATIAKGEVKTEGRTGSIDVVKNSTNNYTVNTTFPEASIVKGTVKTEGNVGALDVIRNSVNDYTVGVTFPEATIVEGEVKTEGSEGKLEIVRNSVNNYTVNATFPEDEVYAAHSDSEEGSEELKELMPDGGIIIERVPGEKPMLKQVVDGDLVATQLGGTQSTYTVDSDETDSILPDVEEGCLIVEGPGPIVIDADVPISAVSGNTLERRADGLFHPKNTAITANAAETEAILPNLAEGTIIIEGPGEILVETAARVSSAEDNIITSMADGIAVNGKQLLQSVFDALHPVGSYVLGTKPTIGTWVQAGQTKILSNSDDQYIVTETGRYNIGTIETGTSKGYTIAPTKTGYDCIGIIPIWGGGRYYSSCCATITNGGTATARTCNVGIWNNSATLASESMFVEWTAIFRSKYGTETVTKWKRTA